MLSFSDYTANSCTLKQCFIDSRTVELLSKGVSELVPTLESRGGGEIVLVGVVVELWKLGMGCNCCVVLLFDLCLRV